MTDEERSRADYARFSLVVFDSSSSRESKGYFTRYFRCLMMRGGRVREIDRQLLARNLEKEGVCLFVGQKHSIRSSLARFLMM